MGLLPTKTQSATILMTLFALYAVHNFKVLEPVKKIMNFDQ
jgi:hypothetical protein